MSVEIQQEIEREIHPPDHDHRDDIPRFEPWLAVTASAIVPILFTFTLPLRFHVVAWIASGTLFASGLLMLRAQNARRARREDAS